MKPSVVVLGFLLAIGATDARAVVVGAPVVLDGLANQQNGITWNFNAGTYSVTFHGDDNYSAWNPWGNVIGCDSSGASCKQGWTDSFGIRYKDSKGDTVGSVYNLSNPFRSTAASALSEFRSALAARTLLTESYSDWAGGKSNYVEIGGPVTFTLLTDATVTFFVPDSSYGDNTGGISLAISAVPEPSTWAMMVLGFAGLGFAASRRKAMPALTAT